MAVVHDINEALVNDILAIYSDAEDKMLKAVAKRVAKGIKKEGWNETKLKDTQLLKQEIEKILGDTEKLSSSKISTGIIEAYQAGKMEVDGDKTTHKTVLDELDVPMNLKMQVLATNNLLSNASFQVLRKSNDAYQKVMAHATTGLLAGTDTRIQATQKMLNEFASKGITTFVDKAGRNWDLASYSEMAVRTVTHNAARQGHFDRQIEVGEDLVKVSRIGTTCPICQRWQGVVLSISGNHPKYHSIEEAKSSGLFHPNCKHIYNMYIEDLDGPGKVEPDPYNPNTPSSKMYEQTQKQRANERNIRYWKKRKALAITPEEEAKCNEHIKKWQYKNLIHCSKHGLRRQYAREGVMSGYASGIKGTPIGGTLKEYEEVFEKVIGEDPKKIWKPMIKLNLQYFAEKKYEQWLKDEIDSLDELDVDKAMMKDASNKAVTPTSLYKKYIGDNPAQDYAAVSEYEKGTKEYKTGYAKWLKTQIDEIGVSYKVKPKYVTIHESIAPEDVNLSATQMYKKYHEGKAPTEAYKELGGEVGTGMKYGKWVESQKKEMLKNGITKTVPFGNTATQKTADTIVKATKDLSDAKLKAYKLELDSSVHGAYDGYLKLKEAIAEGDKDKIEIAKEKHLEMVKKKAEKTWGTTFESEKIKLKQMWFKETDPVMEKHIQSQIEVYENVQASKQKDAKDKKKAAEEAKKKAEEAKAQAEAAAKAAQLKQQEGLATKVSIGRSTRFDEGHLVEREKIYQKLSNDDLDKLAKQVPGHALFSESRRDILGRDSNGRNHHMGHDVRLKSGLTDEQKKLGEAFQVAYNDYFNTIKCQDINLAYLKGNPSATMKKKIEAIRTAIHSVELNEPVVLHRFVTPEIMEAIFKTKDLSTLQLGSVYDNDTFMSAAVGGHPTFGKRNHKLTLQVDKGTHALPTLNYEEGEFLLDKGKLEVVGVKKHTSSNPQKLQNFDGSYTEFVGDEVIVRYVEDGKAKDYEMVTSEKISNMLSQGENVTSHKREAKEWIDTLSSDEMTANKRYTGSWYVDMNNVYRRGDRSDKQIVKYSEDLTRSLRRVETKNPVVLRRGVHESDLAYMLGFNGDFSKVRDNWDKINEGGYAAEDKGFLSTSPDTSGGFSKAVELRIYTPAGTHAAYVDSISSHKGEKETLLNSGSMFKVVKLEKVGYNTIAYLELLGTD